ncbi:MAG: hypothetical protein ACYCT1_01050 [Steroidobacteraceae bacterium]
MPEPSSDRLLAAFEGAVRCTRQTGASRGLTLSGVSAGRSPERLIVSFVGAGRADIPAALEAARVVRLGARHYQVQSASGEWLIETGALHVHRDVRQVFYRAVPPRRVPLGKRLFWRAVLLLARRRTGLRLLRALRGR